ncbi:MAG: molybdopterin-dependent oxidoreductase [Fimbriimonadaceae bacterium]|nr:molybdopterin-dependent oxidoreductase [Chitinophagales bacterium]
MKKDPKLIIHTTDPVNAEPPVDKLLENFITPQPLYYIRNHGDVPEIDPDTFRLTVNGMVEETLELSLNSLKKDFSRHTVMATLQCAGNRRNQMIDFAPVPGEVPWQEGAIGNATWTGAPLKEILEKAGVKADALYVEFMGADDVFRHGENVGFGASIPINKALTEDVLLAYEMNDKPLEPTHGFPLRVVVPGYIGARSVKWLTTITLQKEPSKNYFQDHAYRLFPPEAKAETVDWDTGIQLSELAVNCAITFPKNNEIISEKKITVKGYAMSGDGRIITKVDVSTDGGETWTTAIITEGDHKWAWAFWEIGLDLQDGEHELIARAFDSAANAQPEYVKDVWNFKGYMNNAWHKIRFITKN